MGKTYEIFYSHDDPKAISPEKKSYIVFLYQLKLLENN